MNKDKIRDLTWGSLVFNSLAVSAITSNKYYILAEVELYPSMNHQAYFTPLRPCITYRRSFLEAVSTSDNFYFRQDENIKYTDFIFTYPYRKITDKATNKVVQVYGSAYNLGHYEKGWLLLDYNIYRNLLKPF